jgi:hypothetical protein
MATDDTRVKARMASRISAAFRPRGVTPDGCRWCGAEQRFHFQRWHRRAGLHRWVKPTDQQRLARMKARAGRAKGRP